MAQTTSSADTSVFATAHVGTGLYATFCAATIGIVLLSNWPSYQYAVGGGPIPLYYYLLPGAMMLPLVFAEPALIVRFFRDALFWWFVAYVLTGLAWLLLSQDFFEEATRQWRLRLLAFFLFYTVAVIISEANGRAVACVVLACMLAACVFNWLDALRPFSFVPKGHEHSNPGRGAGLFINANASASFIAMATIAALALVPMRLRMLLLVVALFGVAATISRSGFVLIALVILLAVVLKLVSRVQALVLVAGIPLLLTGLSLSYDYLMGASDNQYLHLVVRRLSWFENMGEDAAVEGRRYGAATAWQMFLEDPITGGGIGAMSRAAVQEGAHNMYLTLMAEQGLLGLALYVALCVALLRRGLRLLRASPTLPAHEIGAATAMYGVFLAVYGLFSHNVLEEPHGIFIMAFFAAAASRAARAGCTDSSHRSSPAVAPDARSPL